MYKWIPYCLFKSIPILQVAGRGHPFELSSPGQVNSSMPQMVGHIIGQGLPSFPVAPFYSIENKIRYYALLIIPISVGKFHYENQQTDNSQSY